MWTPKRILLLALGFLLSVGCYMAYARRLGMVDGLPPLPEAFHPVEGFTEPETRRPKPSVTALKLEMAFGKDCPELKRPIKIEVPSRGLVLAAKNFQIEDDGRVCLSPLSVAMFGKTKGEDGTPEINTIRGEVAYLTFEQPIRTVSDMGKSRITAAQITGKTITVVNNRRSLSTGDDLTVDITNGPLFYDQKKQQIWTSELVKLEDKQSKPKPTTIRGLGMILDLVAEEPAKAAKPAHAHHHQKDTSVTGVRQVRLHSVVDMHIFVDNNSGFLAGKPDKPAPAAKDPKAPAEKAHLIITTNGPFRYDMQKEFAVFDKGPKAGRFPDGVVVRRVHDVLGGNDQLLCDHLELQFRKKEEIVPVKPAPSKVATTTARPAASTEHASNLQLETAHATGGFVTLVSDSERLDAHGNDFFHDARTNTSTLKGAPMWAIKDGNEIESPELVIQNTPAGQVAHAKGPGVLVLPDKSPGKKPTRARWNDQLVSDREGDKDVLHLTGNASFVDEENEQELRADDLKIWLLAQPADKVDPAAKPKPAAQTDADKQPSRRPHHLIGIGNVRSRSKEFNILDAQRLVVWFADASPAAVAAAKAATDAKAVTPAPAATGASTTPVPAPGSAKPPAGPAKPGAAPAQPEPKKPIELRAREVEAHVLRVGEKSELQTMRSTGKVHVVQAPAKPGERGVDIQGDTLNLTAHPEGNFLVVTGDSGDVGNVARLDMDKMLILGPEVNIDQVANKAWVNGIGAMTIDSDTDLEGKPLKKPTPLTIHWNRSMVASGRLAVFHGGIQADQENSRMTCQELQVYFDKPINLRQGQNEKDRAKVSSLVCDKDAHVEEQVLEMGKLIKFTVLSGGEIAYDNEVGTVDTVGPGEMRTLQRGNESPGLDSQPRPTQGTKPQTGTQPKPAAGSQSKTKPSADKDEMKLTCVNFISHMHGHRQKNMAIFTTNVRVLNFPSDNPRMEVDFNKMLIKLPEGGMYLRCDQLKVWSTPRPGGKANQEMTATGRVTVTSNEFHGQADIVKYNEEKDQVIFEGENGGVATLTKFDKSKPGQPETIVARTITYERKTGRHKADSVESIKTGNN